MELLLSDVIYRPPMKRARLIVNDPVDPSEQLKLEDQTTETIVFPDFSDFGESHLA